jgi:hypothetical protein
MQIKNIDIERNDFIMLVVAVVLFAAFLWTFTHPELAGLLVAQEDSTHIVLVIDDGNEAVSNSVPLYTRDSAFDVLKRVATVEYEIFADGAVVKEIKGLANDGNHYWICLVNGELHEIGCDYYYPNGNDVIIYKYATLEEVSTYL